LIDSLDLGSKLDVLRWKEIYGRLESAADKCEDQPYGQLANHRLPTPEAYSSSHGRTPTDVERRCASY